MAYGKYNNPLNQTMYDRFKHHGFSIHDVDTFAWWEPRTNLLRDQGILPRIVIGEHKFPTETIKPQQHRALIRWSKIIKMGQDYGQLENNDKTGVFIFRSTFDPEIFEVSSIAALKNIKTMNIYELEHWFSGGDLEGRPMLTPEDLMRIRKEKDRALQIELYANN